jgi:hypothetical protein
MTRRLSTLALLALFALLAHPARAAKVPKSLCLAISQDGIHFVLVLKKAGRATTAAGKRTFYQVAGEVSFTVVQTSVPVSGSAHLEGDVLHFAVSGSDLREEDDYFPANHLQGRWDVVQRTGVVSLLFLWENGGPQASSTVEQPLAELPCEDAASFY